MTTYAFTSHSNLTSIKLDQQLLSRTFTSPLHKIYLLIHLQTYLSPPWLYVLYLSLFWRPSVLKTVCTVQYSTVHTPNALKLHTSMYCTLFITHPFHINLFQHLVKSQDHQHLNFTKTSDYVPHHNLYSPSSATQSLITHSTFSTVGQTLRLTPEFHHSYITFTHHNHLLYLKDCNQNLEYQELNLLGHGSITPALPNMLSSI